MKQKMINIFENVYGNAENTELFFAPGRVNLIGEYTDFNGGHVMPCTLSSGTYALVRKVDSRICRFYSYNFPNDGVVEVSLDDMSYRKEHDWANYPKGVIAMFLEKGIDIENGFDIAFYGNIPNGAGLSSSASIEILMAIVINKLYSLNFDMMDMVYLAQRTENKYIGVNCGIMDQFAIGMGKKNKGILLNTSNMEYHYSKLDFKDYKLVISNTRKRRGLEDSKYNERRSECESALADLQKVVDIKNLCDLNMEEFEKYKHSIKSEVNLKRAKHVISENDRTLRAYKELDDGNLEAFGKLMIESHESLKNDFEVTGIELDTLVELALDIDGVLGSRMTGAGFGGCTVSLVREDMVEEFVKRIYKMYKEKIGFAADFYIVSVGDGARQIL